MSEPARAQDNKKMLIDLKDLDHKVSWENFFFGGRRDWEGLPRLPLSSLRISPCFFPLGPIAHTGSKKEKKKKKKKFNKPRRSSTAAPGLLVYIENSAQMET
jgi:hypothetical protein